MTTSAAASAADERVRIAVVLVISALLLTTLLVAAAAAGTDILGVPTYYGSGVDSALGSQMARDFLADQQAEAEALSAGDQGPLGGHLTDSALADVIQQISNQTGSGTTPPLISFQPSSLSVLRAPAPGDSSLNLEVQEDGTETVVTSSGPAAAPTSQTVSFHGDFWLRVPSGSHYAIAYQKIQTLPSSPLPAIAVVVAAFLVVFLVALLVLRERGRRMLATAAARAQPPVSLLAVVAGPPVAERLSDDGGTPPLDSLVIRTFGGLHILDHGQDLAQELMSRPVSGFVWLRLLVAAIADPDARPSREEIARQARPGVSRDFQLKRLRNVISKGLPEMPPALRSRIRVEPEAMSFRLDGCTVDAIELIALSAECARQGQLAAAQVSKAERVVEGSRGDFLPEFDALENIATDRHPTCTALVAELRGLLSNQRADLALLLADAHFRAGRLAQAIAVLQPILADRAERKDIADQLAAAFRAAGRDAEAKALEARYS